ncbi:MAG: hypothetical protein ACRELF_24065, partial [Gemmataceae bacterium]
MPIAFRCSKCAQGVKVADTLAGKWCKCPNCGTAIAVPSPKKTEAPAAPALPSASKTRSAKSAVVQEQAVKARRRPTAEDDDEDAAEETKPRSRDVRKKKKSKMSPALLWGLIGGGAFALLLGCSCIGFGVWWFFFRGGIDGDDLKFMPSNCQMVGSIRVDEMMQSDVFKELRREIPEMEKGMKDDTSKEIGLSPEDIEKIVFGIGVNPDEDITFVVHTNKAVDA